MRHATPLPDKRKGGVAVDFWMVLDVVGRPIGMLFHNKGAVRR